MIVETYILYLGTVLLFFAHPPGPSQLLFVGGSLQHGLKGAMPIMAGDLSANAIQIIIAGFGLASLIALSATAFTVLKYLGVAYLIWMGVRMIRDATRPRKARPAPSRGVLFRSGFMTSAANPYAVVFFAALFPQFISLDAPVAPQVAILGATYLVIDGAILIAMGACATRLVAALGSKFEKWLSITSGAALILAAIAIGLRGEPEAAK
ncbi:LysE family translocator [Aliiroseovarius sp. YM-037]|uniref:LysE family translocator n=1 Tax=Aliiroseovarius sp. YM-037 TaxID=3341728 RepID=UPI003A80342C